MLLLRRRAHARAGLIGNPSDGYYGKTISLIVKNFWAEAVLYEWDEVEIMWTELNENRFASIHDLAQDVKQHGYYGGIRLVKATIKRFVDYCVSKKIALHQRNFAIRYETNVPRQVGLAGSTAIVVATLRCLMDFYGVSIPLEVQPSLALAVETQELNIAAGLQDRVIAVYEGLVYMDFAKERMRTIDGYEYGVYERLDPAMLPRLYIAYNTRHSEPTETTHKPVRQRWIDGDPAVIEGMKYFAVFANAARDALLAEDHVRLGHLMDENFDTRRAIFPLHPDHVRMIETARKTGASAKFAGSGGAIIGIYRDEVMYAELQRELGKIGCVVVKPVV